MEPLSLFKCLADDTRLKTLLLIQQQGELCVCELTTALETSQPKVSRHLAQLRDCGLLNTRRDGQCIYYRLDEELRDWAVQILNVTADENPSVTRSCCQRLECMGDRPGRNRDYCGTAA